MSAAMIRDLEALRARLRRGELSDLDQLCAGIEAHMAGLPGSDAQQIAQIRELAEANARCLGAALGGLRAARRRIAELAAAERPATYDGKGRRQSLMPQPPGLRF